MNEKVKGYLDKVKEFFGKLSKKVKIAIGVGLAVILVGIVALVVAVNNQPYAVLFTELSTNDVSTILTFLEGEGITNYRLEGGDTILVPESQEAALKAKVISAGYPESGYGYSSYYDNVSALSTESERNRAFLIALQENLAEVIKNFDGVKDAFVQIDQGEDRSYVLDSNNMVGASASVQVTMRNGNTLSKDLAKAIRSLVSHSVHGLNFEEIAVVDNYGNTYEDLDSISDAESSTLKLELEQEYDNKIKAKIMQVLEPVFGAGNVYVGVNCTVDVNYLTQTSTDYALPEYAQDGSTGGKGIIGSVVYNDSIARDEEELTAGGTVGTESNSDLSTYVENEQQVGAGTQTITTTGQIDYKTSQTDTYTERVAGYLTDCTVSVSINSAKAGNVNLEAIREHVASAAGITAVGDTAAEREEYLQSKISVLSMSFYEEESILPIIDDESFPMWILYAAAAGVLLFLILVVVIVVNVRSRKKRKKLEEEMAAMQSLMAVANEGAAVPDEGGADVMEIQTERSMELRKDIRQLVDDNPEIAAQMVKVWLKGGDENA